MIGSDDEDEDLTTCGSDITNLRSLKLDVVTRWYSILSMMGSLKSRGLNSINLILQKYGKDDLCLSQYEFKLIEALCSFRKPFEKITEILSGEKYSTINMTCLFRSELASLLEEDAELTT